MRLIIPKNIPNYIFSIWIFQFVLVRPGGGTQLVQYSMAVSTVVVYSEIFPTTVSIWCTNCCDGWCMRKNLKIFCCFSAKILKMLKKFRRFARGACIFNWFLEFTQRRDQVYEKNVVKNGDHHVLISFPNGLPLTYHFIGCEESP